jgi:hypothetical protein
MIDTLKLSKRLQAAQMSEAQAEALAEGLNESLQESYVSREYFDSRLNILKSELDTRLARLRTELIVWIVGTVGLGTFINHWWR